VPQTATHINQLGRVIIPVSDQDRSLEFYTDKLGFEVRADVPFGEGDRWLEVAPPGSAAAIAIMPPHPG
jgi:catechol 2,3-dioxygenase-like lactoylglutathione lyase family enzyme